MVRRLVRWCVSGGTCVLSILGFGCYFTWSSEPPCGQRYCYATVLVPWRLKPGSCLPASVLELKLGSSGYTPSFMPCVPPSCFFNVKRIFVCCSEDIILFGYNVRNKCIKIVALFRCVWHICSPWADGPNWICGMKLSCRNCCGQCLHGSTLVFPSCAWLGKASLAEAWLGFFLWEDLGDDGVGLGGS